MKTVSCFFLILLVSAAIAQITFTREWVKGKRSTQGNSPLSKDGHTLCRGIVSALEYLIELERVRKAECSECCHSGLPMLPEVQRTPSDFLPFLREMPVGATLLDPDQVEHLSSPPNGDRRNQ